MFPKPGPDSLKRVGLWKLIPLGLTLAVVVVVVHVAYHEPTGSAATSVFLGRVNSDETCPDAASLAGTWVKAASAPSNCIVTQAVVTSQGGCRFKIEANADGQINTAFANLQADGTLVEEEHGTYHGQLLMTEYPPVLKLSDGCSYVEQTFGAINNFDGGEWSPSCADKLLHEKNLKDLIGDDAKLWWGKTSEGGTPLTEAMLRRFRSGLTFDGRSWSGAEGGLNLMISDDNTAVRVDQRKCKITNIYLPRASGELNERIVDEVNRDSKAKCQRKLAHKIWKIYRSEVGKSSEKVMDDIITVMPISRDGKVFYVDKDGSVQSTSTRQAQRDGLLKESSFRLPHVRVDLLPNHPLKDKVAFLYANNMLVLGDRDQCEISSVYLPTPQGGVSLKLN